VLIVLVRGGVVGSGRRRRVAALVGCALAAPVLRRRGDLLGGPARRLHRRLGQRTERTEDRRAARDRHQRVLELEREAGSGRGGGRAGARSGRVGGQRQAESGAGVGGGLALLRAVAGAGGVVIGWLRGRRDRRRRLRLGCVGARGGGAGQGLQGRRVRHRAGRHGNHAGGDGGGQRGAGAVVRDGAAATAPRALGVGRAGGGWRGGADEVCVADAGPSAWSAAGVLAPHQTSCR
jgi:hypothetical protein